MPFPIAVQSPVTFGQFNLAFEVDSDNLVSVRVTDAATGVLRGTPIRFKLSGDAPGGRLAADLPGCDPNYFVTGSYTTSPSSIENG